MEYLFNESINPLGGSAEDPCKSHSSSNPCPFLLLCTPNDGACGPFCATKCNQLPLNCSCTTQNGDVEQGCPVWFEPG